MTPQELKSSILQLAIQGKLVEQRSEEGTVDNLLNAFSKHQKSLPAIAENEIPFDIPESWQWVRLGSIVFNHGQETPQNEFAYIDIGSIDNKRQLLNPSDNIIPPEKAPSRARKIVQYGDILYATVRPYLHNMCIVDRAFSRKPIASTGFAVLACQDCVYNKYLFYYLLSPCFDSYANSTDNAKGVAYPVINDAKLYRGLVPLPPLAEQKRIVAKIEELLPYLSRYEKAWNRLEDFNRRFPADMQKSILQMAIQGKLVEQRPEEGTGEALYRQIQAEKQALIKAGKIKKEKPLPEIAEDEVPFEIPEGWKWVRLGEIILGVADGPHFSPKYQEQGIPFISTRNISSGKLDLSTAKYISKELHEELCKRCKPKKGDVLYTKGGTTGIAAVNDSDVEFNVWVHVAVLSLDQHVYPYYLAMALNSPHCYELSQEYTHGTSNRDLGLTRMVRITLPLPPLAEQKRIVARLEEILPLCKRLDR